VLPFRTWTTNQRRMAPALGALLLGPVSTERSGH
jgi:hypothetical protein